MNTMEQTMQEQAAAAVLAKDLPEEDKEVLGKIVTEVCARINELLPRVNEILQKYLAELASLAENIGEDRE